MTIEQLEHEIQSRGMIPAVGGAEGGHGHIQQSKWELARFSKFLLDNEIKSLYEVGLGWGSTHRFFREVLKIDARGVDILESCPDADKMNPCQILHADCQSQEAIDWAKKSAPYDCVFIDGSHNYDAIVKDYENYAHMASKLLVFHDVVGLRSCHGSTMQIMELIGEGNIPMLVFCDPSHETRVGIGVISVQDLKKAGKLL